MGGPGQESLSVVIPAFNMANWIERTLDSVMEQAYPILEVVVIDDGSTDGTPDIAERAGARVISQPNRGSSAARNRGASETTGGLLLFLDADDVLLPGAIAAVIESWRISEAQHPVGICVPNHLRYVEGRTEFAWARDGGPRLLTRKDLRPLLRKNWLFANAVMKRSVWKKLRYDETLRGAEDFDFYARALLSGERIITMSEPAVVMTVRRPGSLTSDVAFMRRQRNAMFRNLGRDPRLTPRERAVVLWQVSRTSAGARIAGWRSPAGEVVTGRPRVLQVLLDEPGGAGRYVDLMMDLLGDEVDFERLLLHPARLGFDPRGWMDARRHLIRARVERRTLIHAHGVRAAAAVAMTGRGQVVTIHGLHSLRRASRTPKALLRIINRATLGRFEKVIALGSSDAETVVRNRLAPRRRLLVIPPPLPPVHLAEALKARADLELDERPAVLWMGRMVDQKNPLLAIRTLALLASSQATFLVAGDGPLMEESRRLASELRVPVRFLGWRDDLDALLAASDLFLSTSRWEGLPLALLEAASAGIPVIATDVPGNRDLSAAGVGIVLVPDGAPAAIAVAVADLLKDPQRRAELGASLRGEVEKAFDPQRFKETMLSLYFELQ